MLLQFPNILTPQACKHPATRMFFRNQAGELQLLDDAFGYRTVEFKADDDQCIDLGFGQVFWHINIVVPNMKGARE